MVWDVITSAVKGVGEFVSNDIFGVAKDIYKVGADIYDAFGEEIIPAVVTTGKQLLSSDKSDSASLKGVNEAIKKQAEGIGFVAKKLDQQNAQIGSFMKGRQPQSKEQRLASSRKLIENLTRQAMGPKSSPTNAVEIMKNFTNNQRNQGRQQVG